LVLVGVALWSHPGVAGKINRFTDEDGTLHITNKGAEEPVKSGDAAVKTPLPEPAAPPAMRTGPNSGPPPPGGADGLIDREVRANQGGVAPPGVPPRPPQGPFNRRRMPSPQPVQ
jgi:hypothetical protein